MQYKLRRAYVENFFKKTVGHNLDSARLFFNCVFRRGNKPSVLPREENRAEQQKEGRLYASPVDVKPLLKTIPQHRKNAMTRSRVAVRVMG